MPIRMELKELLRDEKLFLGSTPWIRLDRKRVADFAGFSNFGFGPGAAADPGSEVDPFAAMALIPFLLGGVLQVTDAKANRLVALENCKFVNSIPVDSECAMQVTLISGALNSAGHLVYRLGITIQVRDADLPNIIAEVVGLAGNP